jgi:hypothetical protein
MYLPPGKFITGPEFLRYQDFEDVLIKARREALRENNLQDSEYREAVLEKRITYDDLILCKLDTVLNDELAAYTFAEDHVAARARFLFDIIGAWRGTDRMEAFWYRLDINRRIYRREDR